MPVFGMKLWTSTRPRVQNNHKCERALCHNSSITHDRFLVAEMLSDGLWTGFITNGSYKDCFQYGSCEDWLAAGPCEHWFNNDSCKNWLANGPCGAYRQCFITCLRFPFLEAPCSLLFLWLELYMIWCAGAAVCDRVELVRFRCHGWAVLSMMENVADVKCFRQWWTMLPLLSVAVPWQW